MFPTKGILYAAPFSDERLYLEQISKANFWYVFGGRGEGARGREGKEGNFYSEVCVHAEGVYRREGWIRVGERERRDILWCVLSYGEKEGGR